MLERGATTLSSSSLNTNKTNIGEPKDKGEARNHVGIMLGLVDRPDEVVIGTIERVVTGRTVHRMPAGQRCDAACAKSIGGVPWQRNPAEVVEAVGHGPNSHC